METTKYIDSSEFAPLLGMLNSIRIPMRSVTSNNSRRGFGSHRCMTFGVVRARYRGRTGVSSPSCLYPEIYSEITRIGNLLSPDFPFTSIHLNKNVVCPIHTDSTNVGTSMVVSFGDYAGCELVVGEVEVETRHRGVIFDGTTIPHYNRDTLTGTKYSLVYYTHASTPHSTGVRRKA